MFVLDVRGESERDMWVLRGCSVCCRDVECVVGLELVEGEVGGSVGFVGVVEIG